MPKVSDQTPDQKKAIREALVRYQLEHKLPSRGIGKLIGIGQQAANRILRTGACAYGTATRIAVLLNYPGVDDFYRAHGAFTAPQAPALDEPDPFPMRTVGLRLALLAGASAEAVLVVRSFSGTGLDAWTSTEWTKAAMDETVRLERIKRFRDAPPPFARVEPKPAAVAEPDPVAYSKTHQANDPAKPKKERKKHA